MAMASGRLVAMVEAWGKVGMASYNKVVSKQALVADTLVLAVYTLVLVARKLVLVACKLVLQVDCTLGVCSKQEEEEASCR